VWVVPQSKRAREVEMESESERERERGRERERERDRERNRQTGPDLVPNCLLVEEGKLLHRRDRFHVRVVFDNGRPHGVCDEALVVVRNTWSR